MAQSEKQLANLKKGNKDTQFRSGREAVENGRKGGIESGKSRNLLKPFKQIDAETTTTEEREKMLLALKEEVLKGNVRAWELYLKIVGEMPSDKSEVSTSFSISPEDKELYEKAIKLL